MMGRNTALTTCNSFVTLLWSTRYGRIWLALAPAMALCYGTLFLFYHTEYVIQAMDMMDIPPFYMANVSCYHCNNFTYDYIIGHKQDKACTQRDLYLLFLVTSAPENIAERMAIRRTWGNFTVYRDYEIRTYYVVGVSSSPKVNSRLLKEDAMYKDIIQLNFNDSYQSLTNKSIGALQWALSYCPKAKYIVKTDDDSLNMPNRFVDYLVTEKQNDLIACERALGHWPQRQHKWKTSQTEYPDKYYPPHCKGRAYILSRSAASSLVENAPHVRFHGMEDVYVTGLCRVPTGITCTALNDKGMPFSHVAVGDCDLATYVMNAHYIKAKQMHELFYKKALNQTLRDECFDHGLVNCQEGCRMAIARGSLLILSVIIFLLWYKRYRNEILAIASNNSHNSESNSNSK